MSAPVANIIGIDPGVVGALALVGRDGALIDVATCLFSAMGPADAPPSMRRCSPNFWRDGTREKSRAAR